MSIFGYSRIDQHFTYYALSSGGRTEALQGTFDGEVWRFAGERRISSGLRRTRVTIQPTPRGFRLNEQFSMDNGPWQDSGTVEYVRRE